MRIPGVSIGRSIPGMSVSGKIPGISSGYSIPGISGRRQEVFREQKRIPGVGIGEKERRLLSDNRALRRLIG